MEDVVIATSDQHADSAPAETQEQQLAFFRSLRARPEVRCIISVGDLWSLTLDSSVDAVLASEHCGRVRDLLRELSETRRVILVDGNHDPYSAMAPAEFERFKAWLQAPRIEFAGRQLDTTQVADQWARGIPPALFEHGADRFDFTTGFWKVVTSWLRGVFGVGLATKLMKLIVERVVRGKGKTTPSVVRDRDHDSYQALVALMHHRMWGWALRPDSPHRLVVMGHTHFDEARQKRLRDITYVNCGAFDGFGSSYVEITAADVALNTWQ